MSDDLVKIARDSYGGPTYIDTTLPGPRFLIHVLADEITRLRAELATARRDALEIPAKWHDEQADYYKSEEKKMVTLKSVDPGAISIAWKFAQAAIEHNQRAAAIRAAAGEGK